MDSSSPTAWPPASLSTPFGKPVVPGPCQQGTVREKVEALTAGVDDIQSIRTLHRHRVSSHTTHPRALHEPLPVPLSPQLIGVVPAHLIPLPHDHLTGLEPTRLHGALHHGPVRDRSLGTLDPARGGHDRPRPCSFNPLCQGLRGESAEYGGVYGAQPGNCQSCDERGGDHRHCRRCQTELGSGLI